MTDIKLGEDFSLATFSRQMINFINEQIARASRTKGEEDADRLDDKRPVAVFPRYNIMYRWSWLGRPSVQGLRIALDGKEIMVPAKQVQEFFKIVDDHLNPPRPTGRETGYEEVSMPERFFRGMASSYHAALRVTKP